jgi:hypothetical protein
VVLTAQDAVDDLYRIAVTEAKATSTARLDLLSDFCIQELTRRGLRSVQKEIEIPGAGRDKKWDVGWKYDGKYRLGISLKSLLRNLGGTVPNRIDDLIGEVANAQLHSPEIAIGYVMIFNAAEDAVSKKHGMTWFELLQSRLNSLAGRRSPSWTTGTVEDFVLVKVDFSQSASILYTSQSFDAFFETLTMHAVARNPNAIRNL